VRPAEGTAATQGRMVDPTNRSEVPENVRQACQKDSVLIMFYGGSTLLKARRPARRSAVRGEPGSGQLARADLAARPASRLQARPSGEPAG